MEQQFHKVSEKKTIRFHDKAITGVKFIRGSEIKRPKTYYKDVTPNPIRIPIYDEVVLSGGQRRPRQKDNDSDSDNPGDQIGARRKK